MTAYVIVEFSSTGERVLDEIYDDLLPQARLEAAQLVEVGQ
jgi:hypothetical protein